MIPKIIVDNNIAGGAGFKKLPLTQTSPVLVFRKNLFGRFSILRTILYLVLVVVITAALFILEPILGIAGFIVSIILAVILNATCRYDKVIVIPEQEIKIWGKSSDPVVVTYDEIESFRFYTSDIPLRLRSKSISIFVGIDAKDGRRIPLLRFLQNDSSRASLLKLLEFFRLDNESVTDALLKIFGEKTGKVLADEFEKQLKSKKIPKKIDNFLANEIYLNKFVSFEKPSETKSNIDVSTQKTLALELFQAKKMFSQKNLRKSFFTSEQQQKLVKYDLKKKEDRKTQDDSEHILDGFWKILRLQKAGGFLATVIKRPIAVLMVVIGVLVFGWISYDRLALMLMPPLNYPTLTVRTDYPAASPEIVEEEVSNVLEENLGSIEDLVAKSSISRPERSEVYLEFKWGTNISQAATEVRQKFGRIRLPMEAENPLILKYDPTLEPIMRLVLLSTNDEAMSSKKALRNTLVDLLDFAKVEIKPELEKIEGVAAVKIEGGLTPRIHVQINENKLKNYNLTLSQVNDVISAQNTDQAAGTIEEGNREYLVRIINKFKSVDDIRNLEIKQGITLDKIADIIEDELDPNVYTRFLSKPAIEIAIQKEANANMVEVSKRVWERLYGDTWEKARAARGNRKATLEAEKQIETKKDDQNSKEVRGRLRVILGQESIISTLGKDKRIELISDQAFFIEDAIDEVKISAMLGGLLAIFVLFAFLRDVSKTFIIALAIPISVVATFAPMKLFGISLNIMSLGGLALGIGMLVDNAIVVLESIARCREEGDKKLKAAARGVSEVATAITASTLTTIAVFGPVIFVEGVAGQIFKHQALTVVFSLLISLFVALFVIPTLAARGIKGKGQYKDMLSVFKLAVVSRWLRLFPKLDYDDTGTITTGKIIAFLFAILFLPFKLIELIIVSAFEITGKYVILLPVVIFGFIAGVIFYITSKILKYLMYLPLKIFEVAYQVVERIYPLVLRWSLNHKIWILIIAMVALVFTGMKGAFFLPGGLSKTVAKINEELGIKSIEEELIPTLGQDEFSADFEFRQGVNIDYSNMQMQNFELAVQNYMNVDENANKIERYYLSVGNADRGRGEIEQAENLARLVVIMNVDSTKEDVNEIQGLINETAQVNMLPKPEFRTPVLFSFKTPLEVEIRGNDLKDLDTTATEIQYELANLRIDDKPVFTDMKSTTRKGNPEIVIRFLRHELVRRGLTSQEAVNIVKQKIQGSIPTQYKYSDKRIDLFLEVLREENLNIGEIQLADNVKLKDVWEGFQHREGPSEIRRRGNQRVVVISATSQKGISLSESKRIVADVLSTVHAPLGVSVKISGQTEEMERSLSSLIFAFVLAIFLVYIVMASQFESLLQPFIIMLTIPLSLFGVIIGLVVFDLTISVVVLIGVIMLAGIVVNNAIVLVDRINYERRSGKILREAIIQGSKIRLRPVLITSLTTILGLFPLAGLLPFLTKLSGSFIGIDTSNQGIEMRAPMAIAVIFGLAVSTLLTLIVIPAFYEFVERILSSRKNNKY